MDGNAGTMVRGADGRLYLVGEQGAERIETAEASPGRAAVESARRASSDAAAVEMVTSGAASRNWRASSDAAAVETVTSDSASRNWRATTDAL